MIITLLTDFGTTDYFVGAMKGVILSAGPAIRMVDLSHDIPPHDIASAAFLLGAVHQDFPPDTVHLVVVDPGVGSERAPLAVRAGEQLFVGPDNGVFSRVMDGSPEAEVRLLDNPRLRRQTPSATFHGRDIFAPAAAALALGFQFADVGPRVANVVRLPWGVPEVDATGQVRAHVVHIDRFGNCVTSIRPGDFGHSGELLEIRIGETKITELRPFYAAAGADEPFAIWGSAGLLEISVAGGSAAERMGIDRGQEVTLAIRNAG